jgi:hypothetical protein
VVTVRLVPISAQPDETVPEDSPGYTAPSDTSPENEGHAP